MKNIVLLVLTIWLAGCSLLQFPQLNAPKPPQTTYQYEQTFEKNPTAVAVGDKIVVVENQRQTVIAGYKNEEKPLSFWQRFCNWLGSWSIIAVIATIILLSLGITGPFLWIFQKFLVFKKTTKQLVRGIEEAKATETNPQLKTTLASMLDTDSKRLIDDIKRE